MSKVIDKDITDLGDFIKKVRTERNLKLIPLAAKASCSTSSINTAENHLRKLRIDTAERVLKALGFNKKDTKEILKQCGYYDEKRDSK